MSEEKTKPSLDSVLKNIAKKTDVQDPVMMGDSIINAKEVISTEYVSLDYVTGCGGIPQGRLIEIYGENASGKTLLSLLIASKFQKQGKKVIFIDAERTFNPILAKNIGVDISSLIVITLSSAEETLDAIYELTKTGEIGLIIIDSVSSLVPNKEIDGSAFDNSMAVVARLLSTQLRKQVGPAAETGTTIIYLNQIRASMDMFKPETTSGGKALPFYASLRLKVTKKMSKEDQIIENGSIMGHRIKIKAEKNKMGIPFRETELQLHYTKGINMELDTLEFAKERGIISLAGASYSFGDIKLGQGKGAALEAIKNDKTLYNNIINACKKLDLQEIEEVKIKKPKK